MKAIGYYGETIDGWVCGPAGYWKAIWFGPDGQWRRGAIKNNNDNYGGNFQGYSQRPF